jgi:hypothetical protein
MNKRPLGVGRAIVRDQHTSDFIDRHIYPNEAGRSLIAPVLYEVYCDKSIEEGHTPLGVKQFGYMMKLKGYEKGARPVPNMHTMRASAFLHCHISITIKRRYDNLVQKYVDRALDRSYTTEG